MCNFYLVVLVCDDEGDVRDRLLRRRRGGGVLLRPHHLLRHHLESVQPALGQDGLGGGGKELDIAFSSRGEKITSCSLSMTPFPDTTIWARCVPSASTAAPGSNRSSKSEARSPSRRRERERGLPASPSRATTSKIGVPCNFKELRGKKNLYDGSIVLIGKSKTGSLSAKNFSSRVPEK